MTSADPTDYALDDRYTRDSGRVYLNGMQALVRLLLAQHRRDRAAGLNTAGYVSGYRGSPIGTLDLALWQAQAHLDAHQVRFEPGLNEDLAATMIQGSQQASLLEPLQDGVFGRWYGKGPGVDRSCDALKHANYHGVSRHGGVLVVAGDDPGAKSSSLPHQSEAALAHCGIPVLAPANLQELLDYGHFGWALSRYSGAWVGLKCVTDLLDASASVAVDRDRVQPVLPEEPDASADLANPVATDRWIRFGVPPLQLEQRAVQLRLPAVRRFVRANGLDRIVLGPHGAAQGARLGIVCAGKTSGDVLQALAALGIDGTEAMRLGLAVYKPALVWPLETESLRTFANGLTRVLVVEEKRPLLEEQVAAALYGLPQFPTIDGKRDQAGAELVPDAGELTPDLLLPLLARWLGRTACSSRAVASTAPAPLMRLPAFCAGCPHNTSTRVPEGSRALAGIGCHGMAVMLPDRPTLAWTHMGAEGSNWIGISAFSKQKHVFQNMGDGTYTHSGLLAIRAAVAAKTAITYKILINGAIAMTGGQPIEGHPSLDVDGIAEDIVAQLVAEGVTQVVVVSDDPQRFAAAHLPAGVTVEHRDRLDSLQRRLREVPAVTAILYDQVCAAEKRRLGKRGQRAETAADRRRLFINEAVCDGCGDCGTQSNCIAIEPVETPLGRKRRINQDACNTDHSCLKGFCPSFAVLDDARLRPRAARIEPLRAHFATLPELAVGTAATTTRILVTGIGGAGVVTVAALLGMAAHLEGRVCQVLDQTGAAQKNGAVTSHVQFAAGAEALHASRIGDGAADLVIGCDIVGASTADALRRMAPGRTVAVVNAHVAPTADFARLPDLALDAEPFEQALRERLGTAQVLAVDALDLARTLLGRDVFANLILLGMALQRGLLGVSAAALERAIVLNGSQVRSNLDALALGRLYVHDPAAVQTQWQATTDGESAAAGAVDDWRALMERNAGRLTAYQNAAYAARYRVVVERVAARETAATGTAGPLALTVARNLHALMAYKDEYEVARLWSDPAWRRQLDDTFEPGYRLRLSLAPQGAWFAAATAPLAKQPVERPVKRLFGRWVFPLLRVLAACRSLRGGPLDLFGHNAHRRRERALIGEYEAALDAVLAGLTPTRLDAALAIACLPEGIRGYGVKEQRIADARQRQRELLAAYGQSMVP